MSVTCSNKNRSCLFRTLLCTSGNTHCMYVTCLCECSLMFSSGSGKRVQINKECGRLLARESEYPPLPAQKAWEDSLGKLSRQDTRQAKKHVGNDIILVLFIKVLANSNCRILNSFSDCENEPDASGTFIRMSWY